MQHQTRRFPVGTLMEFKILSNSHHVLHGINHRVLVQSIFTSGESQKWNVNAYQVVEEKEVKKKEKCIKVEWNDSKAEIILCNAIQCQLSHINHHRKITEIKTEIFYAIHRIMWSTNRFHIAIIIIYLLIHDLNLIFSLLCYFLFLSQFSVPTYLSPKFDWKKSIFQK